MYYKWKIYYRHYYYSSCWFSSTSTTATAAVFAVFMIFSRLRPKRHFSTLSPRREARLFIYNVSRGLRRWAAQKTEICLCFDSVFRALNTADKKTRENEESANLTWKLWKKLENMTVNILGKWSLKLCGAPPHDLKSFGGKLKAKWVIWKEWASANHLAKLAPLMHCLTLPKRLAGPILMDHHESQGATFSAEKKGSLPGIILKFVA